MKNTESKDIPSMLLVDSSGFDGSSVPDNVSKTVALRMLENRRKRREVLAQELAITLHAPRLPQPY